MARLPYLVSGRIKNSNGNAQADVRIVFTIGSRTTGTTTDSNGDYVVDLQNLGYSSGDTVSYDAADEFNNEFFSGSFVGSGQNKTLNLSLSVRVEAVYAKGNRNIQVHNIGGLGVSKANPFPVTSYFKDGTEGVLISGVDKVSGKSGVDGSTETLIGIDYAHHEIHDGNHFLYTDSVEIDSAQSQVYLITTPNSSKYAHMIFVLNGSAITQFLLYEGGDRVGTTLQTLGNSNRNSSVVSGLTIHKGVSSGSTDGTLIQQYKGGSATNQSRSGSGTRNDEEIILRKNTKYLLKVVSGSDSNLTDVRLSWYEHVDKN